MEELQIATGDVDESSIIIIACRRLAPAAMGIGISENEAEEGVVGGRPSAMKSLALVIGFVYRGCSPFACGRGLIGRCIGRSATAGGGEGDDGSEGSWGFG